MKLTLIFTFIVTLIDTLILLQAISGVVDAHGDVEQINLAKIMEVDDDQGISFGIVSGIDSDQDICEMCCNVMSSNEIKLE